MVNTIYVFDPVAPFPDAASTQQRQIESPRGKVFGFIDNSKPNFALLVDDLATLLTVRYGMTQVLRHTKAASSVPAGDPVYGDFARQCDVVVTGSGD